MTPIDKASQQQKDAAESEDDPRLDWEKEDSQIDGRLPNLEEVEDDTSSV